MKISVKLFLTLVGLTAFILTTTLLLSRWAFTQGFQEFHLGIERQRLESIAEEVVEAYLDAGQNWQASDKRSLDYIIQGQRGRPPHDRPPRGDGRRPPSRDLANNAIKPGARRPPPTALYDNNGKLIVGRERESGKHQVVVPVLVESEVVGKLRSHPQAIVTWGLASSFSRFQTRTSIAIAIAGIILSAFISLFLTKHILKPIVSIRSKVSLLTQGVYSSKFELARSDELGELMKDIATLSSTLDKTRAANKRWIADISHELRTPLTILSGEIETLKAGYRPLDQHALVSIEQEVSRLSLIVNDLYHLSLADIGGLSYQFSMQNINTHIERAVLCCEPEASNKGIAIHFENGPSSFANIDEQRIQQLFMNILNNAIAYTDAPGKILIAVSESEDFLIIEFDDTPPCIDAINYEHIFEPLFREDFSRARRGSGAGLGLSICKSIVEAHKGQIRAKLSPHGGLKIQIELPRSKNQNG